MNKKMIGIIVGVFAIIIIVGVCIFIAKNNSTQNVSITIKGYTIDIKSKEVSQPSSESYFNTSFKIINSDQNTCTYNVEFVDLKLDSENTDNNTIISDNDGRIYDTAEQITINGKKFSYDIDENNWNATLYYRIPDEKGQLIIKVRGGSVVDSEGYTAKTLAFVDKEVLESKELAKILDFSINK